ncbi:MAG TPA: ABC transporter permease, partial [Longimicrobiales bacterium]|nr:ABC transporter permease [Longimicrobiales bacterium]
MNRRGWLGRLLGLGHRTRHDSEAELRFHVEERMDRLMAEGWSRDDARREVERRFGDFEATLDAVQRVERQRVRRGRMRGMVETIGRTVATTGRMMVRSPAYAFTVIATLALGLGASTAMFSVLYGALLRPLPYPEPDQLVRVHNRFEATGGGGPFSVPNFLDVRSQARSLEAMAGYQGTSVTLADEASSDRIGGLRVTTNFFDALGVPPTMGRGFAEGEDRAGAGRTVVLTHELWRTRFAEDPDVLGATLRIDDEPHTVVGVLPESFWFPGDARLVVPFEWDEDDTSDARRGQRNLSAVARLRSGDTTSPETLARELTATTDRIAETYPDNQDGWVVTV